MQQIFLFFNQDQEKIVADGDQAHYLYRVLRIKPKEKIIVGDGKTCRFLARVLSAAPWKVELELLHQLEDKAEPPLETTLIVGLPKKNKMDYIIQKCTEIGVCRIWPLRAARSVVCLESRYKIDRRLQRWQKIAREAAQQCQRTCVPDIAVPADLKECLSRLAPDTLLVIPWEEEKKLGLKEFLADRTGKELKRAAVLIGPEGGFAEEEISLAGSFGACAVSLGPRLLKTETACITALSLVLYEAGDLGGYRL